MSIADRRRRVAASVDRAFGEAVRVVPMLPRGGYVVPTADPERPAYETTAKVSLTAGVSRRTGEGGEWPGNVQRSATSYRASFAAAALGPNPPPKEGDHIQLLDQPGAPVCRVAHLEPPEAGHGRLVCHLARVA